MVKKYRQIDIVEIKIEIHNIYCFLWRRLRPLQKACKKTEKIVLTSLK